MRSQHGPNLERFLTLGDTQSYLDITRQPRSDSFKTLKTSAYTDLSRLMSEIFRGFDSGMFLKSVRYAASISIEFSWTQGSKGILTCSFRTLVAQATRQLRTSSFASGCKIPPVMDAYLKIMVAFRKIYQRVYVNRITQTEFQLMPLKYPH